MCVRLKERLTVDEFSHYEFARINRCRQFGRSVGQHLELRGLLIYGAIATAFPNEIRDRALKFAHEWQGERD